MPPAKKCQPGHVKATLRFSSQVVSLYRLKAVRLSAGDLVRLQAGTGGEADAALDAGAVGQDGAFDDGVVADPAAGAEDAVTDDSAGADLNVGPEDGAFDRRFLPYDAAVAQDDWAD